MNFILTAKEMKDADARTIASGTPSHVLMERAARAALDVLLAHFDTTRVLFLCGNGNNGGDGFAMARLLYELTGRASVLYLGKTHADGTPDAQQMSAECAAQYKALPHGVTLTATLDLVGVTAIVDAMLGIGITRALQGAYATTVDAVNQSGIPVLAVDIPSGICADTGRIWGKAIRATHTVTMAAYKYGTLLYPGASLCGVLHVADIGVHVTKGSGRLLDRDALATLPSRPPRAHKGTFGRVLVIGGSHGMSGAAHLCAKAAYRAGAGLVEIFAPEQNRIIHQIALPEALVTTYDPETLDEGTLAAALSRADAIAVGMGLGCGTHVSALISFVLKNANVPLVLDADALNAIAKSPALASLVRAYRAPKVLTPHLGEMSRLAERPVPEVAQDMPRCAAEMAIALDATVVLKDARTVICDGKACYVNPFGNSGMATGGCGDVLAGIIATFAATKDTDAALHGVLAHALAGDAAKKARGSHALMASDVIDALGDVLP